MQDAPRLVRAVEVAAGSPWGEGERGRDGGVNARRRRRAFRRAFGRRRRSAVRGETSVSQEHASVCRRARARTSVPSRPHRSMSPEARRRSAAATARSASWAGRADEANVTARMPKWRLRARTRPSVKNGGPTDKNVFVSNSVATSRASPVSASGMNDARSSALARLKASRSRRRGGDELGYARPPLRETRLISSSRISSTSFPVSRCVSDEFASPDR